MATQTIPKTTSPQGAAVIAVKDRVHAAIEEQHDRIVELAHGIHEHPEIAFQEEYACEHISTFLANERFTVRKGVYGLPTAFVATIGNGPLHIAFCAEYDALPPACVSTTSSSNGKSPGPREVWLTPEREDRPLRHACGHNLIAGAAVTAAIGLRDLVDELGLTVTVLGTPGEELVGLPEPPEGHLAGGKIELLEAGAFDGVHAALMAHPGPSPWSMFVPTHAFVRVRASFSTSGPKGHSEPTGHSIGVVIGSAELKHLEEALRETIMSLHQIPTLYAARPEQIERGAQADMQWVAASEAEALAARGPVRRCFEEAATSGGVTVELTEYPVDGELRNDPMLSASFRENSRVLGCVREHDPHIREEIREVLSSPQLPLATRLISPLLRAFPRLVAPPGLFMKGVPVEVIYSTDLVAVSKVIPSIHPCFGIGGTDPAHTTEFAEQADTQEAYQAMVDGGMALAWTAVDAATEPTLRTYLLGRGRSARNR